MLAFRDALPTAVNPSASLPAHEALSGVFGSISLAAWIFLLVPQLLENYKLGSADGVSLAFIGVWFIGDVANLLGAVGAGLVPTVIALAIYFCSADLILLSQCLYYHYINAKARERVVLARTVEDDEDDSEQPLLSRTTSNSLGLPGSRRHSSTNPSHSDRRGSHVGDDPLVGILGHKQSRRRVALRNTLSVVLICTAGVAGWLLAWQLGAWTPAGQQGNSSDSDINNSVGPQILGYFSALCYLGARIPQIIKNYQDQSCEGLSLLFFILSLFGNVTYGLGILCHSLDREYLIVNTPWLIGSFGTIIEDVAIFVQFRLYRKNDNDTAID
ncbi:MAG: hypothetical protein M1823_004626 [Watsoniomyces obsoletus]|nr:MAG: hypothetical protein M1823_004626 [Watsoniomyces obsoletus]